MRDVPGVTTCAGSTGRSVARTGELMIRQDESSRRSTALVFVDTREGHARQEPTGPCLRTRDRLCAASVGVLLPRYGGFSLVLAIVPTPRRRRGSRKTPSSICWAGVTHSRLFGLCGPGRSLACAPAAVPDTTLDRRGGPSRVERAPLVSSGPARRSDRSSPCSFTPTDPVNAGSRPSNAARGARVAGAPLPSTRSGWTSSSCPHPLGD